MNPGRKHHVAAEVRRQIPLLLLLFTPFPAVAHSLSFPKEGEGRGEDANRSCPQRHSERSIGPLILPNDSHLPRRSGRWPFADGKFLLTLPAGQKSPVGRGEGIKHLIPLFLFLSVLPLAAFSQPTVSIYSPTNGTTYLQPTNVPLTIQISVSVSSDFSNATDLYDGTNYLGSTNLKGHHVLNWSNVTFGSHQLLAVHHAASGLITSAVVNIQVNYGGWAVVAPGSIWTYLDGGIDPGPAWFAATYDTSSWSYGRAKFGFGDDDVVTWVNFYNPINGSIFPTYYFRRAFAVTNASAHSNLAVRLRRDDGAVVYLNGEELFRDNLPPGEITYWTYATRPVPDENIFMQRWLEPAKLREGFNLLAVEIHNVAPTSEDIGFDLALVADIPIPPPTLNVQRLGTNVVLSWPGGYEGYSLEAASSMTAGAGAWSRVTNTPFLFQDKFVTTNRIDAPARYYRLSAY